MAIDPDLQSALEREVVGFFLAVEIQHPLGTVRLLDGPGMLSFNSALWTGNSPMGSIGGGELNEDSTDEAPTLDLTLLPSDPSVFGTYAIPEAQGAGVFVWTGAFDPATMEVLGQPDLRFAGEIDEIKTDRGEIGADCSMMLECVTGYVDLMDTDDFACLSNAFHQFCFAGELGFQYITAIRDPMPWGQAGALPVLYTG